MAEMVPHRAAARYGCPPEAYRMVTHGAGDWE